MNRPVCDRCRVAHAAIGNSLVSCSLKGDGWAPMNVHACDAFSEKKGRKRKRQVNVTSLDPGEVLCVKRGETVFEIWENKGKESEDVHIDARMVDPSVCPIDHSTSTGWCARCGRRVV